MRKSHNLSPYEIMLAEMMTVEKTDVNWTWDTRVNRRKFLTCATRGTRMPPYLTREGMRKARHIGGNGVFSF